MQLLHLFFQKRLWGLKSKSVKLVLIFCCFALLIGFSHFFYHRDFGLYEDDYAYIGQILSYSPGELVKLVIQTHLSFMQGRPLHPSLIYIFSFLGYRLAGIDGMYWIGWLIISVNALLLYLLLKRVINEELFGITGTLAFCLFPADTTQAFLTHALGIQPALTFFLLASHAYFSKKLIWAYLGALGILLCYETMYPVFWAIPFLYALSSVYPQAHNVHKTASRMFRGVLWHSFIMGVILCGMVLLRKYLGEDRVSNLVLESVVKTAINRLQIGPTTGLHTFIQRPIEAFQTLDIVRLIVLLIPFMAFVAILMRAVQRVQTPPNREAFLSRLAGLYGIGMVMVCLAYPLTLTVPASIIDGRGSRVHFAAVVGAALLVSCLCLTGQIWLRYVQYTPFSVKVSRQLFSVSLSIVFALLVSFAVDVQHDYQKSWWYQQAYWTDLVRLCPDLEDGTLILVPKSGIRNALQIRAHSWSSPLILKKIYDFPETWKYPRVYQVFVNRLDIQGHHDDKAAKDLYQQFKLDRNWTWLLPDDIDRSFSSKNTIFLSLQDGSLVRIEDPIEINGQMVQFKRRSRSSDQPNDDYPEFPKGPLYDELIQPSIEVDYADGYNSEPTFSDMLPLARG